MLVSISIAVSWRMKKRHYQRFDGEAFMGREAEKYQEKYGWGF
jgi:hypothetical protein